jgi:nickel-dependent lactate racemase
VATDERQLVDLGMKTSYGTPAIVNKIVAESDYVVGIGLVEPHFFAGYSGGRKTVLPAVAGKEAIFNNHNYRMIAHTNASYGVLEGNPIHLDMMEFMNFVNLSFIVNVTINDKGEVSQVFAGNPVEAHKQAVQFLNRHINIKLRGPADIVMVSNGGYPLDRDLYQTVKGMTTAKRVVRNGGIIIIAAECRDGLGGHEEFRRLMHKAGSPEDVLREIRDNEPINDQWQAQVLAMILEKAKVIVVTDKANHKMIREAMMKPASTLEEALDQAKEIIQVKKPKITAIPEGPYVIPNI